MSVNRVILVGNLGKDPEIRDLQSGDKVATFPLATSESYKNKEGQRVNQTEWHNLVLWRGLAKIAEQYLNKGSMVYVEGKLRTRTWEDKEKGITRYSTEVVVDNLKMLGGKKDENNQNNQSQENTTNTNNVVTAEDNVGDDLPF